ncbi:uncharacterized protein LOC106662226 isoform X2 [Cimex lectularius]|nr:uncharacterized protein LOC106662226 isoform X2 [Cimex lectularius]XP_014241620.1 uncharacterized protein LOC106662226 isoform X2 [Cimex lectularius]XP_014241621.1 uncharacterized protein LOC106662226 isoform X2 [Cimex lectularius]XP_024081185.1 uncharacterized protein LOC106662226 isoform X2 [Cimex lectularius]
MKRTYGWAECPLELLENVLGHLDHEELLAASGVSALWYNAANNVLQREGKCVYRWPARFPKKGETFVCIVGKKRADDVLRFCKEVEVLELRADETDTLPPLTLLKILKCAKKLKSITIAKYQLNKCHVVTLLTNALLWNLKIKIERSDDLNKVGLSLLKENREIFSQLCIECTGDDKIELYYPSLPIKRNTEFLSAECIYIDCTGLGTLAVSHCSKLILKNAFYINAEDLKKISHLPIKHLKVTHSDVEENEWDDIFSKGFRNLETLVLRNCSNFSKQLLTRLERLTYLEIDVNKQDDLHYLMKMESLKHIKIHLPMSLVNYTKNLQGNQPKKLELVIDLFSIDMDEMTLEKYLSEISSDENITVDFKFSHSEYSFKSKYNILI